MLELIAISLEDGKSEESAYNKIVFPEPATAGYDQHLGSSRWIELTESTNP